MRYALNFIVVTFTFIAMEVRQETSAELMPSIDEYLHTQLASYEVLQPVKLISKRSADDGTSTEHLHFRAFHRQFHLVLKQSDVQEFQQNSMNITVVQNDTRSNTVDYNNLSDILSDFYTGYIDDEPNSRVSGYIDNGRLHLTVYEENSEVLNIEPLSLLTGNVSDRRLLVYYDSRINDSQYRCGLADDPAAYSGNRTAAPKLRSRPRRSAAEPTEPPPRRAAPSQICRLQVVADHTFVGHVGSVTTALKMIIKMTDDVNEIFLSSNFTTSDGNETFTGIGFEVRNLVAMSGPTAIPTTEPLHFNAVPTPDGTVSANRLLDAFGDFRQNGLNFQAYCLSHLVAFRRVQDRVLGLAYQGSRNKGFHGGLCSLTTVSSYARPRPVARNLGLTTFSNQEGVAVLTRQATLVMAHELSHNLGSPHDPPVGKCNPGPKLGGNFLMHEKAVTGQSVNHNRLSECSRQYIGDVVQSRPDCFSKPNGGVCGNNRREAFEACDAGPLGDDCCLRDCSLKPGAVCSDANSPCCRGCSPLPAGVVCRRALPLWPCSVDAVCVGGNDSHVAAACPAVPPINAQHAPCLMGTGVCSRGVCHSLCQLANLRNCRCPEGIGQSCLVCCSSAGSANCSAHWRPSGNLIRLPGCVEDVGGVSGGMLARLWRLTWRSGGGSFATILRKNMVFVVILLSLLVWVPVCSIIEYRAYVYEGDDDEDEDKVTH